MAGWHHWLNGCESEWTPGVGDGQGGLACCDSWGRKESDTTERLIWSDLMLYIVINIYISYKYLYCYKYSFPMLMTKNLRRTNSITLKYLLINFLLTFSSVQSLSCVQLFATPWTSARQASLSITNSQSPLKLISIESVMPSNHLILCCPFLLLPSIFPSIKIFSKEEVLHIRWPTYWSFTFSISPSNEHPGLISFRMDWLDPLQSKGLSRVSSNTTVQKHQFCCAQLSL